MQRRECIVSLEFAESASAGVGNLTLAIPLYMHCPDGQFGLVPIVKNERHLVIYLIKICIAEAKNIKAILRPLV